MYEYAIGFKPMHLRSHPGGVNRSVISIADEIANRGGGATVGEMVKQSLESKFLYGLATMGKRQKTRCPHKWCWRKGIHVKGIAPNRVRFHIMHDLVSVSRIAVPLTAFGICPSASSPTERLARVARLALLIGSWNPAEVFSAPLAGHRLNDPLVP
jgi:hypothetical protein